MSQKALYRKYRSISFDEVLGQEHITETLRMVAKSGKFSHAYLFTGPRGVGKTSVARLLAYEIIGQKYDGETPEHIDIIEIDAASNTGVDDVRELREKAFVSPAQADYKVYVIDEVHMLSKAAFNALLKILEEPPKHVVFILATTETHKIPDTVASRTQRYGFRPIPNSLLAEHILAIAKSEKIDIENGAAELIAQHGRGSFRDAISLLDQLSGKSIKITQEAIRQTLGRLSQETLEEITQAVIAGDTGKIVGAIDKAETEGAQSTEIAQQLAYSWRQLLIDGQPPLSTAKTLQTIEQLLAVTKSDYSRMSLEVVLIRSSNPSEEINQQPTVAEKPGPVARIVVEKPRQVAGIRKATATEPQQEVQSESAIKTTDARPMTEPMNKNHWNTVLNKVKTVNNSLYALLRMSHMECDKTTLHLHFGFPFHHKRMQDKRNQKILIEAIAQEFGFKPELQLYLDETKKPDLPPTDKQASDVISVLGGEKVAI